MKKTILIAILALASVWSTPVTFFLATIAGTEIICRLQHCDRNMAAGDQPQRQFTVVARSSPDAKGLDSVLLLEVPQYLAENPAASFRMTDPTGSTEVGDEGWTYAVVKQTPDEQIIATHFLDDLVADETYRVRGNVVTPLTAKMENSGYMFSAMPFALLFAWALQKIANRVLLRMRQTGVARNR
jgi:hypothetical protein